MTFTKATTGPNHPRWKGGRRKHSRGYTEVWRPGHPHAYANGYVLEHILIASTALGKPLPKGSEVHHINGRRDDNRPRNLVVCEDHNYHYLLHQRASAFRACGNPSWLKCRFCGQYDAPENMALKRGGRAGAHRECRNAHDRARYSAEARLTPK